MLNSEIDFCSNQADFNSKISQLFFQFLASPPIPPWKLAFLGLELCLLSLKIYSVTGSALFLWTLMSVGLLVGCFCPNFIKGWQVTLPGSYRSTIRSYGFAHHWPPCLLQTFQNSFHKRWIFNASNAIFRFRDIQARLERLWTQPSISSSC